MAPTGELPTYAWFFEEATEVRGSANWWPMHHAPFLWTEQSRQRFAAHTREFWRQDRSLAGYRQFVHGAKDDYYHDVESGPVVLGLGTSATAFGIGAARSVAVHAEARDWTARDQSELAVTELVVC
jgi:hypothetical protein